MKDIQNPRANLELSTEFGIKGGMKLQLDEVIVPVRVLTPQTEAKRRAVGMMQAAAVAAEIGIHVILNRAKVPIEVYRIVISNFNAAAGDGAVRRPTGIVAGLVNGTPTFMDAKNGFDVPTALIGADTPAAGAPIGTDIIDWHVSSAERSFVIDCEGLTLQPQSNVPGGDDAMSQLLVYENQVNVGLAVTWFWREPQGLRDV